eukprot:tig00000317_g24038.t1
MRSALLLLLAAFAAVLNAQGLDGTTIQAWLPDVPISEAQDAANRLRKNETNITPIGDALVRGLYLTYDPATNSTAQLSTQLKVSPPPENSGLFAVANLAGNSELFKAAGLFGSAGYMQPLIDFLTEEMGYVPGEDLWAFPYDWRTTNGDTGKLDELHRLVGGVRNQTGRPVTLLAHSMGGLLSLSVRRRDPRAFLK